MFFDSERVSYYAENYPAGTRVVLYSMDDPYSKLSYGDEGTVTGVDDMGQIHVDWDCGSSLALIPDVDSFALID